MARTVPCPSGAGKPGHGQRLQQAFHTACQQAGFGISQDTNGQYPAGLGVAPSNNIEGRRMSAALTYLMPMRHRLNLTVRGPGARPVRSCLRGAGPSAWKPKAAARCSPIEADRVVLSAGAIRSPQLLMLSGIGPKDHLQPFHIPLVHESPGVGQNLWNHLSAQIAFQGQR